MKRRAALGLAFVLFLASQGLHALGLAEIELLSALNEPLNARIPLKSMQPGDLEGMQVALGSREQFERAGIERPFVLTQIRFSTVTDADGGAHIAVTTQDAVREPFLNFLVEVNWPRGRVLREYTVLLDPPVYGAAITTTEEPQVIAAPPVPETAAPEAFAPEVVPEPVLEEVAEPITAPAMAETSPMDEPAPAQAPPVFEAPPTDQQDVVDQAVDETAVGEQAMDEAVAADPVMGDVPDYGPAIKTDTLWSLAKRYRPDRSVSINQTMLAMLRLNPDAFFQDNVNSLKEGAVLRIPDREAIEGRSQAAALEEVKGHHALWEEYRQTLVPKVAQAPEGAAPGAPAEAPGEEAAAAVPEGEAGAADAGSAAVAETTDRLQLVSAGEAVQRAEGEPGASADVSALQNELTLTQEQLDSKELEIGELEDKLKDAEELIQDFQRLIELRNDELAALQQQLAEAADAQPAEAATPEAPTAPPVEATAPEAPAGPPLPELPPRPDVTPEAAAPVQPEPAPAPPVAAGPEPTKPSVPLPPKPEPEPTTFLDALPVDPMMLGGGLAGLLVLVGGYVMVRRRRSAGEALALEAAKAGAMLPEEELETEPVPFAAESAEAGVLPEEAVPEEAITEELPAEFAAEEAAEITEDKPDVAQFDAPEAEVASGQTVEELEEDPLAEVNVYLAYERFDQAEDIVRTAIEKHPDRNEYKLKLLEVHYAAKNVTAFEAYAGELQEAVGADSPLMEKAAAWWQELSPDRELFAPGPEAPFTEEGAVDVTSGGTDVETAAGATGSGLDFDLGFEGEEAAAAEGTSLDFELGADTGAAETDEFDGTGTGLDFVVERPEGEIAAESSDGTSVDFDIGGLEEGSGEALPMEETAGLEGAATSAAEASGLDFELEGVGTASAEEPMVDALSSGQAEEALDFDLGLEAVSGVESEATAITEEDSGVDLDLGSLEAGAAADAVPEDPLQKTVPTLDFNLGGAEEEAAEPSGLMPEAGAEGTVDFDLDLGEETASGPERAVGLDLELEPGEAASDFLGETPAEDASADETLDIDLSAPGTESASDEAPEEIPAAKAGAVPGASDEEWQDTQIMLPDVAERLASAEGGGSGSAEEDEASRTVDLGPGLPADIDEIQTKLDLAQAYIDMGDHDGARGILDEVMAEGNEGQKEVAKALLGKLG